MISAPRPVALLVGASQGLGAALARVLYPSHDLMLASRNVSRLEELMMSLHGGGGGGISEGDALAGGRVIAVGVDVREEEECRVAVARTVAEFGRLDVLIYNTGVNSDVGVAGSSAAVFHAVMDTNVIGLASLIQFALPHLEKSKGLIVAISSMAGLLAVPGGSHYSASKHALEGFLESIRPELRVYGVDLSVVEPGSMQPEDGSKRQVVMPNGNVEPASEGGTYRSGARGRKKASPKAVAERILRESIQKRRPRVYAQWSIIIFLMLCVQFWFPSLMEWFSTRNRFPNGIPKRNLSTPETSISVAPMTDNDNDKIKTSNNNNNSSSTPFKRD